METVALDQFYNAIPLEIAEWLRDQQPATLMEAAGKVVEYQQNHKSKENGRYPRGDTFRELKRNAKSNEAYKSSQLFRKKDYHRDVPMERESPANMITCYNCRKLGHIAKNCPGKAFVIKECPVDMCYKGEVHGKFVSNIQIDTGACRTEVKEDLVSRRTWKDSVVKLRIADNTKVKCPVADVIIKTGNIYQIEAAIAGRCAPWQRCIAWERCSLARIHPGTYGTDEIKQTYRGCCRKSKSNYSGGFRKVCTSCKTRAQKIKRLEEEVQTGNQENESGGKPSLFRTSNIENVQPAMSESSVVSSKKSEEIDEEAAIDTQESEESTITEEDEENHLIPSQRSCLERVDPIVRII